MAALYERRRQEEIRFVGGHPAFAAASAE
jgi:hypothetical protein